MTPNDARSQGWTLRSVLLATGISFAGMMIALQLYQRQLWPDIDWSYLWVPAIGGSLVLAKRHPGTRLLTIFVFFPLLIVLMFYTAACFPIS